MLKLFLKFCTLVSLFYWKNGADHGNILNQNSNQKGLKMLIFKISFKNFHFNIFYIEI